MSEQQQSFEKKINQLKTYGLKLQDKMQTESVFSRGDGYNPDNASGYFAGFKLSFLFLKIDNQELPFLLNLNNVSALTGAGHTNAKRLGELANLIGIPTHQIALSPTDIHAETRFAYFNYSSQQVFQSILQTTPSPWIQSQLHNVSYERACPIISPHLAQNPHLSPEIIQQTAKRYEYLFEKWENYNDKTARVVDIAGKIFGLPKLNKSLEIALKSLLQQLKLEDLNDEEFKNISYPQRYPTNLVEFLKKEVSRKKLLILDDLKRQNKDEESVSAAMQDINSANLSSEDIELLAQQFSFRHENTKYSIKVWSRVLKDPNTPDKVFRQFEKEFFTADQSIINVFLSSPDSALYHNPRLSKEFFAKIDWSILDLEPNTNKTYFASDLGINLITDPNIPPQVQILVANKLLTQADRLDHTPKHNFLNTIFSSPNTSSEVLEIIFPLYTYAQTKKFDIAASNPNLYLDIITKNIVDLRSGKVLAHVSGQPIVSRSNLQDFIKGSGDQFLPKLKILLRNAPEPSDEYTNFIAGFDFSTIQMDSECLELLDRVLFDRKKSLQGNLINILTTLDLDKYYQINPSIVTKWLSEYNVPADPYTRWSNQSDSNMYLPLLDKNVLKFRHLPQTFVDIYSNNILFANFQTHIDLALELFPIIFENPCFAHLRGHLVNVYAKSPEFSPLKMIYKMTVNQAVDVRTEVNSIRTIYQLPQDFSKELSDNHSLQTTSLELLPYCPWQIQKDIQSKMDKDLVITQRYLQLQQMLQNPKNKRYLQRFALPYFIKTGEVQPELLLRAEKYFPIFQEILDITDVATADNRHSALARFSHNEAVNQGVAEHLNPVNPKGLPQLIARCQEFIANDASNVWKNTKNGLEVLTAEMFANLELQISQEEPRCLKLYFRNVNQRMFTGLQINQLSQRIKLKIEKQKVEKDEIFTLSIPLMSLKHYADLDMIQELLEKTIKTLTSAKLAEMPDYKDVLAKRSVEEIRERDKQVEQAYQQRIAEIQADMEKYGSQTTLSIIDGKGYDKKLNGEIDLPEPNELEIQLLESFEKKTRSSF